MPFSSICNSPSRFMLIPILPRLLA
jgi:hypothetical protein